MILKNFVFPFGFALVLVVIFEYLIFNPRYLWLVVGAGFAVVALAVMLIVKIFEKATLKQLGLYLVLPLLFTAGMIICFTFLASEMFQHFFVVVAFFLFWLMFCSIVERHKWHKEVFLFLTITTSFLLFFSLLNLLVLTGIRSVYYVVFAVLCLILFAILFWYYKVLNTQNIALVFVGPLLMFELFWTITFLPLSALIGTIILAVLFYLFAGISLDFARKTLALRSFLEYVVVSMVILTVALITATWFPPM